MPKQKQEVITKDTPFRVVLTTADGSKVMDRKGSGDFYFQDEHRNYPEQSFIDLTLKKDCAMKGVRLVKYEITKTALSAIVEWC